MQVDWRIEPRVSSFTAIRNIQLERRFLNQSMEKAIAQAVTDFGTVPTSWIQRADPAFDTVEAVISVECPNLEDELRARIQPLQMQWRARGPGIIRSLKDSIGFSLRPITIYPSQPWLGGDVLATPDSDVVVEAVLTDINPTIPEVVRLAWGIAQTGWPDDAHRDFAIATVPATLAAAAEVELVEFSEEVLRSAIELWRVADGDNARSLAQALFAKWAKFQPGDSFVEFAN
jgi:hypothetical protein